MSLPVHAPSFESLDLVNSFLVNRYECLGQVYISRSSGQGQGHGQRVNKHNSIQTFAGAPPLTERQSCLGLFLIFTQM